MLSPIALKAALGVGILIPIFQIRNILIHIYTHTYIISIGEALIYALPLTQHFKNIEHVSGMSNI